MPVEIRELVIRAVVAPSGAQNSGPLPPPGAESEASRDEIVAECVREVLLALQRKEER